ncbi:hypothetical protein [Cyanothece sp. BG0011]|uniref:hypothetical protein n=1 Tax=Cyanothece sp. BG0011 TaxID=2082950 RepID=UPI000D1F7B09|nr:hypothetical protein [Cyanothece sp. BG0011]
MNNSNQFELPSSQERDYSILLRVMGELSDDPVDLVDKLISLVNTETRDWKNPDINTYCQKNSFDSSDHKQLKIILQQELRKEGYDV